MDYRWEGNDLQLLKIGASATHHNSEIELALLPEFAEKSPPEG
jgi:hypothetical protein